jgi:N-hydroxyarylamine O-acetyltransferase
MFDLDAYLARIGLRGKPSIGKVHRAHITSIPFENLDPFRGVAVSVALEDLERKLVVERRGGYCFEHNLLLKAALEALGADVELLLARVRVGGTPGAPRPRSHLVLRVGMDGAIWHADVGFGRGSLLEPIPFGPGVAHEQSGWRFRVVQDDSELVLQIEQKGEWADLYGFVPEPVPLVDIEVSNWFTSTHPRSPFVTNMVVSVQGDDGACASLSGRNSLELTEQTPTATTATPVVQSAVPELLAMRFGLPGFAWGADGRLVAVGG